MKFLVDTLTKRTPRVGKLNVVKSNTDITLATPTVMIYTQGGQVPQIGNENLKLLTQGYQIKQIPIANVQTLQNSILYFNGRLSEFIGSPNAITYVTLQDSANIAKIGPNSNGKVPIFTRSGMVYYDHDSYMKIIKEFKPDIFTILSDGDTSISSSVKRIENSVINSKLFLENYMEKEINESSELKESFVIAPIVGGYNLVARTRSIATVLKYDENIDGYMIDGLFNNGPETEFVVFEEIEPVVKLIIDNIPEKKLRCIHGCWNPVTVLQLVKLGVDLFDTSYCFVVSERTAALTFVFDSSYISDAYEINLKDDKYENDFQNILNGCKCLTCNNYSRAYINYLFSVNELVGHSLLMIHNLYHYLRFFEKIRSSIMDNTLDLLLINIKTQFLEHKNKICGSHIQV